MNDRIKHLIKKKKAIFQKQNESNSVDHAILGDITLELSNAISFSKAKYHERLVQLNFIIPNHCRNSLVNFQNIC